MLIHCLRTGWAEARASKVPRGGKEKGHRARPGVCTASLSGNAGHQELGTPASLGGSVGGCVGVEALSTCHLPTYIRSLGQGPAHYGLKVNSHCLPVFAQPMSSDCTCAKWLQSCPTLCNPMGCSLPGPSYPWDSPGKNMRVGCHALLQGPFPTEGSNWHLLNWRQIFYH